VVSASLDAYRDSYPPVLLLLTTPLALMAHVAAGWYAFYRALGLAVPGQGALLSRRRFSSTRSADRTAPGWRRCSAAARSIPLQCSFAMQLFSYNFTDLTTFDSPQKEIWLDEKDLPDFGKRTARETLAAMPDLQHKGLCVGIYDEAGEPISYVPLDTLQ
jgi:hypothetical protein